MSGFRLYSLEINNGKLKTDRVEMINNRSNSSSDNYFTLIIGNNGTGKSRILSEIARFFNTKLKEGKQSKIFNESHFEFNIFPSKIIAITNSISDKFPVDSSFRPSRLGTGELYHRNFKYNYLGTRNRFNSFSNKALMNRALEIVFESYYEYDVSRNYRHIFDYLDYEPIIKINYKFRNVGLDNLNNISPKSLINLVEDKTGNPSRFGYNRNEKLIKLVKERAVEISDFILERTNYRTKNNEIENEITINFSEKNIGRIRYDNSLYSENVYEYEIINILRKLGLIRNLEIQVFKKGGMPFNFTDASSGEASILSTLLSLIPLLKNDSLILIDEPEISLHPLWQSKYIDLLNKILENVSGCHVIIASHSPFLASDLNPNKSSVITLKNRKGHIKSETITNSTYGWSSEDILLNVFEMPSTRNFDLYENVTKALKLLADNNRSDKNLKVIQNRLIDFYPSILDDDPIKAVIKAIIEAY
ncbi:ATP-binding protein [Tenacibaculum finnmarkense]|uniref:ATP-binding protein n=1 Tax=Tenacibaculum finnmarkense TaxID=2781243 RepID=UPI001EFAC9AE|nr:ATP-binding protein [Tenacibaculum finnmarkense]MCG8236267.1 ATP-binding protein [Tenacibaculum finnmarkense genomovar ulcerans]MCG8831468.1 ATP-binding protein [Tenacibaculum finnmarkense]